MADSFQKIGLGSVQFGLPYGISNNAGKTPKTEVGAILRLAIENGIQLIDTAFAYGDAENVLGENDLSSFDIVSKFIPPQDGQTIAHQLQATLRSLHVDSIYGYLAHNPADVVRNPDQWNELLELKEQKLVKKVGFSFNEPGEVFKVIDVGFCPDLIQVPYNFLDRRFEPFMIDLKLQGCEVHSRSAFLQGLFFSDTAKLSSFFDEVKPVISSLQKTTKHLPGALLRFVIERPFIDKVIVGVNNAMQLKANLEMLSLAGDLPRALNNISERILTPSRWPKN
jgi:aryl-alcohol dehydrogenase-like predicted oxidoreductase